MNGIKFSHVINMTCHHVGFYDTFGYIAVCAPGYHANLLENLTPDTMVIVDSPAAAAKIPETNAVKVGAYEFSRLGTRISQLFRLSDGASLIFAPATAPKAELHEETYFV